jgi:RHS repeat-associated protein
MLAEKVRNTIDGDRVPAYDTFDRVVEVSNGSHEQVVYGPGGGKLALMNGQTLQQAFVPLAGGAEAVYTPGGLAWYRHPDWLGSSRLASTPSRTVYYDGAYAPYGESYAESGTADHSFTGQNQNIASSGPYPLYDFMAREYNPSWGRWLSPDPMGGDITNPQSLNRYAYVDNNPASLTDPMGLSAGDPMDCTNQGGVIHCDPTPSVAFTNLCVLYHYGCEGYGPYSPIGYIGGSTGSSGYGGGGGTGSGGGAPAGPLPSYGQVLRSFNNCAANFADKHSVASSVSRFLHIPNNPVLDAALGSTTAAASSLIFQSDPKGYVPAGASLASGAKAGTVLKLGATAAGKVELTPGFQSIFTSVAPTTLYETALGRTALSGVKGAAGLLEVAAPALILYDELMYGVGEGVCTAQAF